MQSSDNERAVMVVLPNVVGYEKVAMAGTASFARLFGCPPDRVEDLKTLVAEAAVNAMIHGNRNRPESRVTVTLIFKEGAIQLAVLDEGKGIGKMVPDPDIDRIMAGQEKPGGFGLFLIRRLADDVQFVTSGAGGHAVKMMVRLEQGHVRNGPRRTAGCRGSA
jgi:anti-sigma regulatory factor (Ser/Thr protein kinase)